MKNNYLILVDTGTTNSRCLLLNDEKEVVASAKQEVGVRNVAIEGNNCCLKKAVKECIESVLIQEDITYANVSAIYASGMITSNVGLVEVPHLIAPVGKKEFLENIHVKLIEDVAPIPIQFVPGVKNMSNKIDYFNFEQMDIMRGEEVETLAILDRVSTKESLLIVLPGSHTKFVSVDSDKKITGCLTTLSGELLSCITNHTILADVVKKNFVDEDSYDEEMLQLGFRQAATCGIGRACFSARILDQFVEKNPKKMANYLLGVALQNDMVAARNSKALDVSRKTKVMVGGKNPLKKAIACLIREDGFFEDVQEIEPKGNLPLSAEGILALIKEKDK